MMTYTIKKHLESRMLRKLHVRFGVGVEVQSLGLHHKGFSHALTEWRQVVEALRYLREEKGMIVVLLAHSKIEKFSDPESTPFDRFSPRLNKQASAFLSEWCDAVLLATRKLGAAKGEKAGGERILRCIGSPACLAKNR
ncbi:MAG TPA: AAA family ATPase, partial [Opitutales bacterium]|nr:AAA family ATPase [Opitutales bacterium]